MVNRKVQRWFGMVRYDCVRVGGECKVQWERREWGLERNEI